MSDANSGMPQAAISPTSTEAPTEIEPAPGSSSAEQNPAPITDPQQLADRLALLEARLSGVERTLVELERSLPQQLGNMLDVIDERTGSAGGIAEIERRLTVLGVAFEKLVEHAPHGGRWHPGEAWRSPSENPAEHPSVSRSTRGVLVTGSGVSHG